MLHGPSTRRPPDMKVFLQNSENKCQLNNLLLKVWGSDDAHDVLKNRNVILIVEGIAYKFTSSDGKVTHEVLSSLNSNQEETDTRVIIYTEYAANSGFSNVVIRSPDSDIFFILLNFPLQFPSVVIYFDTGNGKHRVRSLTSVNLLSISVKDIVEPFWGCIVLRVRTAQVRLKGREKLVP